MLKIYSGPVPLSSGSCSQGRSRVRCRGLGVQTRQWRLRGISLRPRGHSRRACFGGGLGCLAAAAKNGCRQESDEHWDWRQRFHKQDSDRKNRAERTRFPVECNPPPASDFALTPSPSLNPRLDRPHGSGTIEHQNNALAASDYGLTSRRAVGDTPTPFHLPRKFRSSNPIRMTWENNRTYPP